jgi:hypothetical protein
MCCGKQRRQLRAAARAKRPAGSPGTGSGREPQRYSQAYFQYLGRRGIIVQGPASGYRYRFERHGVVAAVDPRDQRALSRVPNLRQVRGPA